MAITVKKKKMTLKSAAPEAEPEAPVVAPVMSRDDGRGRKSGGSFVPYVVMGLLACALLGALIALQVMEDSFYTGAIPQHGAVTSR